VSDSRAPVMPYRYQPVILEELARFGVFPTENTPPALVHEFINDLYRFELRRLRERLTAGEIRKGDYTGHVIELRRRYPLVSIRASLWLVPG
jgi:hypothetical protein